jgi:hypothetical protein
MIRCLAMSTASTWSFAFKNRPGYLLLMVARYACTRCARGSLCGLRLERISVRHQGRNCHLRLHLSTADDHHEQLIRSDQRHRRPCGHGGTD